MSYKIGKDSDVAPGKCFIENDEGHAIGMIEKEHANKVVSALGMYQALKQIAEGKGRYSMDRLTHATNTIEDMKGLAQEALANVEVGMPILTDSQLVRIEDVVDEYSRDSIESYIGRRGLRGNFMTLDEAVVKIKEIVEKV